MFVFVFCVCVVMCCVAACVRACVRVCVRVCVLFVWCVCLCLCVACGNKLKSYTIKFLKSENSCIVLKTGVHFHTGPSP